MLSTENTADNSSKDQIKGAAKNLDMLNSVHTLSNSATHKGNKATSKDRWANALWEHNKFNIMHKGKK